MSDYISREAAWRTIKDVGQKAFDMGEKDMALALMIACEKIEKLPDADAIEQVEAAFPKWIRFETRPMDEEERREYSERFGYELTEDEAVIYCSQLPEHGQEVLVCNKYGNIWIDTFDDDPDYGVGFETNGDMDGLVAWMPLPEPPKEVEE